MKATQRGSELGFLLIEEFFGARRSRRYRALMDSSGPFTFCQFVGCPFGVRGRGGEERKGPNKARRSRSEVRTVFGPPCPIDIDDELCEGSGASGDLLFIPSGVDRRFMMPMDTQETLTRA
jgi:hypothetical protein